MVNCKPSRVSLRISFYSRISFRHPCQNAQCHCGILNARATNEKNRRAKKNAAVKNLQSSESMNGLSGLAEKRKIAASEKSRAP